MCLSCRGHGNMQFLEIWCCSHMFICCHLCCDSWIRLLVKLRKSLNSPFIFTFLKLSRHVFLWLSFSSSPSLLRLPPCASFFFQVVPSLLLLLLLLPQLPLRSISVFSPPSMWLQPFSHPTSNQPYSALRWSSHGPQVDFYLSVHEAPFLYCHLPNTTPSPPTPLSTGMKMCSTSYSALGSTAVSVAPYIFLLSVNIYIKSVDS